MMLSFFLSLTSLLLTLPVTLANYRFCGLHSCGARRLLDVEEESSSSLEEQLLPVACGSQPYQLHLFANDHLYAFASPVLPSTESCPVLAVHAQVPTHGGGGDTQKQVLVFDNWNDVGQSEEFELEEFYHFTSTTSNIDDYDDESQFFTLQELLQAVQDTPAHGTAKSLYYNLWNNHCGHFLLRLGQRLDVLQNRQPEIVAYVTRRLLQSKPGIVKTLLTKKSITTATDNNNNENHHHHSVVWNFVEAQMKPWLE